MGFFDDLKSNIDGGIKSVQSWGADATETLRNLTPTTKAVGIELDKITGKNNDKLAVEKAADIIVNAPQNIEKGWNEFTSEASPKIEAAINQGLKEASQPVWERESTQKILGEEKTAELKNTVESIPNVIVQPIKETVTNVTKGVSDALPIVALGGGAIILASLLLGRR